MIYDQERTQESELRSQNIKRVFSSRIKSRDAHRGRLY